MAKAKIKLTRKDKDQLKKMAEMGLRAEHIASVLGFSRKTFYNLLDADEQLRIIYESGKAAGTEKAVKHLMQHIDEGSEKSLHFYLKFISGYRGVDEYDTWREKLDESRNKTKLPSKLTFEVIS